jgi:uncharacterized protein (TIGR03000 family)
MFASGDSAIWKREDTSMFKTLWRITIVAVVGATLVLMPSISEAQRRGGGGGGRGGGGGGFRGGERGFSRGWGGGWGWGVGLGWGYPGYYGWGYPGYYDSGYYYSQPQVYSYAPQYSYYSDPSSSQSSFYPNSTQNQLTNPNDAGFVVRVPDPNADVWFEDYKTQQRGVVRQFETESLDPNNTYTYHVRARWMKNGQPVEQTRTVQVRPGQNVVVDFTTAASEQIQTLPNQRVPLNAPNQQTPNRQQNQQAPNRVTPVPNQVPIQQVPPTIP